MRYVNGIFVLVLIVSLMMSCSSSKKVVTEIDSQNGFAAVNEDFDPLSLGEPGLIIKTQDKPADVSAFTPTTQNVIASDIADSTTLRYGYRVQIAATLDEETAREIRKEAILKFDEAVYWVYDRPYFKIRVGDCLSRFEAEDLQEFVIKNGFVEAWVIRTLISPTKKVEIKIP